MISCHRGLLDAVICIPVIDSNSIAWLNSGTAKQVISWMQLMKGWNYLVLLRDEEKCQQGDHPPRQSVGQEWLKAPLLTNVVMVASYLWYKSERIWHNVSLWILTPIGIFLPFSKLAVHFKNYTLLMAYFRYSWHLFAGLNQLLWYFAEMEKQKCYHLPGGLPDWDNNGDACMKWRRFGKYVI